MKMTAEEYIKKANEQIQSLFSLSLHDNKCIVNEGIDLSFSIQKWLEVIPDDDYKSLIKNSVQSLEVSLLSQTQVLYRNAFVNLRISLEMFVGGIYFSTNLLDFIEWTKSSKDINWATINDANTGVLSPRFFNAFFKELKDECPKYYTRIKDLYRDLSKYVHGNHHTWISNSEILRISNTEIIFFEKCLKEFKEIVFFIFCLRYLHSLSPEKLETVEPSILENLNHVLPIQEFLTNRNYD